MHKKLGVTLLLLALATIPSVANAQPSASGGGCQNQFGTDICIACTGSSMPLTIYADFYVNNFSTVDSGGYANLFICITGVGCYYQYSVFTNFLGHYPVAQEPTGLGAGDARNEVDFFDSFGGYITTGFSPQQYWIP